MLELKENQTLIKEYEYFYLVEVACPNDITYKTTIDKWKKTDLSYPSYDKKEIKDRKRRYKKYINAFERMVWDD